MKKKGGSMETSGGNPNPVCWTAGRDDDRVGRKFYRVQLRKATWEGREMQIYREQERAD